MSFTHVSSYGPKNAKIAIVGEAPGKRETELGKPFVGASGNLLSVMCSDSGIDLKQCRLLNICETRPPGNNFGSFYYDTKREVPKPELLSSIDRLKKELFALKPNLILTLGKEPLRALTGHKSIEKWRGTIHKTPYGKLIGTYHPAAILRMYHLRPTSQIDLSRCFKEQHSPEFEQPRTKSLIRPTFTQVMEFLETYPPGTCAFDTETFGRLIRCLGLSRGLGTALCIPFIRVNRVQTKEKISLVSPQNENASYWLVKEEKAIVAKLYWFFQREDIQFIAQNFSFDMPLLESNFGLRIKNFYLDTMHAHHLVYPELLKSLDFLTSIYTNLGYYADYDPASDEETWLYNTLDCIATIRSSQAILGELEDSGMKDFYFNQTHPLVKTATRVQSQGVLINVKSREALALPLKEELEELRGYFESKCGVTFKKQVSPKQVKEYLRSQGIPVPVRQGVETTDARALLDLRSRYPNLVFINKLLQQREKQKFYGTYVTSVLDPDNRMRTSYDVSGTDSGRLSSSQTIWGTGGNNQNIPKNSFRRVFIAPKGRKFLHADLSQAETRLVSWLCRDLVMIDKFLFEPDFDVHRFKAHQLYNVSENQVSSDQRYKAKQCNHSGNYGIRKKKFSYISGIPLHEAGILLELHQNYEPLRSWWKKTQTELLQTRTLYTPEPFHRRRVFYGRLDEDTFRVAYNWRPQATVGDIVNQALWQIESKLDPNRAVIILQVHDEIDLEVDDDYITEAARIVKSAMEVSLTVFDDLPELIIPVDLSIGPNWWDQEELKI